MWNIKKITILLCFLSLVAFISCSAEDKTGSPKPEGETETTEIGNFPPPDGTYKDPQLSEYNNPDTTITIAGEKTTIKGKAKWSGGGQDFQFEVSKWNKTKTTLEAVSDSIEDVFNTLPEETKYTSISIIYDNDTQTLKITFKDAGAECLFNGTKQP